jgi:hypothetical protein
MTGMALCCARAVSGHITAVQPRKSMNWRRFTVAPLKQATGPYHVSEPCDASAPQQNQPSMSEKGPGRVKTAKSVRRGRSDSISGPDRGDLAASNAGANRRPLQWAASFFPTGLLLAITFQIGATTKIASQPLLLAILAITWGTIASGQGRAAIL